MSNDLSPIWIKEHLAKAKTELKKTEDAYNSLQNKGTQYANGISRIMEAQRKVVEIWFVA